MDQTPATEEQASSTEGDGGLRPTLLAGLTTLIAALTAVATVQGSVARMFRNHPWYTTTAIVLVLVALLAGLLSQIKRPGHPDRQWLWFTLGSVALVLGMGFGLFAQVKTTSLGDRPTIVASTKTVGSDLELDADVKTEGAKAHDQIVVMIYGLRQGGVRTAPLYYSKTGPDSNGDLTQNIRLMVDPSKTPGVYMTALVVPEGIFSQPVDCDGNEVNPDGSIMLIGGKTVPFHTPGNPLVGCVSLMFP